MARRSINYIPSAATPIQSGAATLQAWAAANAGMADKIGDVGDAFTTGVEDWAKFNEAKVENYLEQFPDDTSRRIALANLMDYEKQEETGGSQIGRFTKLENVNEAVEKMQLRDMKVEERAEQALRAEDLHRKAAHELTQAGLMDPKLLTQQDATTEGLKATTGKVLEETGGIGVDQRRKARELGSKILYETAQTEKLQQATKTAKQTYDVKEKKRVDTIEIGKQYERILEMPILPNPATMPEDLDETGQETWRIEQKQILNMAQLAEINKQIEINEAAGKFDDNERLKKFTRKHLTQSGFQLTNDYLASAGVTARYTPDSHNALINLIMTDLARVYPHNTQTELKAQANKIISTHPANLNQRFIYGKRIADMKDPERLKQAYKTGMNKEIKAIQTARGARAKLAKIAEYQKLNDRSGLPPEQQTRFDATARPIIESFVSSINADAILMDSLPAALKADPEFTKHLQGLVNKYKSSATAIANLDSKIFDPTVQRNFARGVRKAITDQLGPMLRSELTPLVNMVLGEHPSIGDQFKYNKEIIGLSRELTKVKRDTVVKIAEQDATTIIGFQKNLSETIIKGIYKTAEGEGTKKDINGVQLAKSVSDTIRNIKTALGVDKDWTPGNINALNIAIGGLLSGVRVDYDWPTGNDYVLPHIAMGTDIRELRINQLIEGLKAHLQFAAGKVKGNSDIFQSAVKKYVDDNPGGAKAEGFVQGVLERGTIPGWMEIFDNRPSIFGL